MIRAESGARLLQAKLDRIEKITRMLIPSSEVRHDIPRLGFVELLQSRNAVDVAGIEVFDTLGWPQYDRAGTLGRSTTWTP